MAPCYYFLHQITFLCVWEVCTQLQVPAVNKRLISEVAGQRAMFASKPSRTEAAPRAVSFGQRTLFSRAAPCTWRGTLGPGYKPIWGLFCPAVTREQSPALPRNSNGRLEFPGPTQEEVCIPCRNSRIRPQLEKNHVIPPSSQDEALSCYSVSREGAHSILKFETVLGTLDATQKFPYIPVSFDGNTEVPGTTSLSPFSPPDHDRRVESPALSRRGSRPSRHTTGWGQSHEEIRDVASWLVPHSEWPQFPGPLLIRYQAIYYLSNILKNRQIFNVFLFILFSRSWGPVNSLHVSKC